MDTKRIIYSLSILVANIGFFGFVYWALAISSNNQIEIIAIVLTILYIGGIVLGVYGYGPLNKIFKKALQRKKAEENERLRARHPWE